MEMRPGTTGHYKLRDHVAHWQTPAVDSFRSRSGDRKHEMGLSQQAKWPTPVQRDYKDGPYCPNVETNGLLGRTVWENQVPNGSLSPKWVTQLMGFPNGWLDGLPAPANPNTSGNTRARRRAKPGESPNSER